MLRLREVASRGFKSISQAIRQQPDYNTEVSETYLDALQTQIDARKPANFKLTPISEPGW